MKAFVLGFAFNPDMSSLLLIEQPNGWNGLGGKTKRKETITEAMEREFKAESGIACPVWEYVMMLKGQNYAVYILKACCDLRKAEGNVQAFPLGDLPELWADLHYVLPLLLGGEEIIKPLIIYRKDSL